MFPTHLLFQEEGPLPIEESILDLVASTILEVSLATDLQCETWMAHYTRLYPTHSIVRESPDGWGQGSPYDHPVRTSIANRRCHPYFMNLATCFVLHNKRPIVVSTKSPPPDPTSPRIILQLLLQWRILMLCREVPQVRPTNAKFVAFMCSTSGFRPPFALPRVMRDTSQRPRCEITNEMKIDPKSLLAEIARGSKPHVLVFPPCVRPAVIHLATMYDLPKYAGRFDLWKACASAHIPSDVLRPYVAGAMRASGRYESNRFERELNLFMLDYRTIDPLERSVYCATRAKNNTCPYANAPQTADAILEIAGCESSASLVADIEDIGRYTARNSKAYFCMCLCKRVHREIGVVTEHAPATPMEYIEFRFQKK